MKKDKEWFIKELLGHEIGDYGNSYNSGYEDGLAYALKLAHQLDEPEKVVIPQFVADWWERDDDSVTMYGRLRAEKKHKFDLISIFYDKGLGDYLSKAEDWIYENNSAFLDLVNGKPYEVEEEQKYYTLDSEDIPLLERWGNQIQRTTTELSIYEKGRDNSRFELTEKEIKDYDERYWSFAVEVAE